MFVAVVSVCACAMVLPAPDRMPAVPQTRGQVEGAWIAQLERDGTLTIPLKGGKVVFLARMLADGKLISPKIVFYDGQGRRTWTGSAKEAGLGFDPTQRRLLIHLCDWTAENYSGGGHITLEAGIWRFEIVNPTR